MRHRTMRVAATLLLVNGVCLGGTGALAGCAHSANAMLVSGTVETVCPGPIILGRPRSCLRTATFRQGSHRYTVRGRFSVRLPRGRYRLTVDGCSQRDFFLVRRAVSGVHLVPYGCAYPL